jgi:hypothetical protein
MCESTALKVGDDLLDQGVGAVSLRGFQHDQWEVGEHPVVAVGRKQLTLACRDRLGAQTFDPARSAGR